MVTVLDIVETVKGSVIDWVVHINRVANPLVIINIGPLGDDHIFFCGTGCIKMSPILDIIKPIDIHIIWGC